MSFLDDIAGNKKIASPKPKPKTEQKKTPENSINKKAEILGIGTGLKKNNITVSDKHLKELKRLSKKQGVPMNFILEHILSYVFENYEL